MCAKKTITGIIKLFEILNEIKKKMVNIDKILSEKEKTKKDIDKILSEKEKTKKDIDKILFALYFFFKFIEMTNLDNNFVFKILDKHIIENKIYTFFKNILSKKQKNRRGGTRKIGGGKQSKKCGKLRIKTKKNGRRKPKQTGGMFAQIILLITLITITSVFSISGINNLFNNKNVDTHKEIYDLCQYPLLNNKLGSCSMGSRAMIGHKINQTIDNVYTDSLKNGMYIVEKNKQNVFRHGTSYEQINIEYKNFDYKNKEDTTLKKYYEDYVSKFVGDDIKYVLVLSDIRFEHNSHAIVTIVKKQINSDGSISYLSGGMDPNYLCTAIQYLATGVDNGIEKFMYVPEGFFDEDDPASKFSTIANDPYQQMVETNFGKSIIGSNIAIETEYLTPSLYLPFYNEQNLRDIEAATKKVMQIQTTIPDFVGNPSMKNLVMNIENIIKNFEIRYIPEYTIFNFNEIDEYIKEQIEHTDDETFYFPLTFMQDIYSKIMDGNGILKFDVDESGLIRVENTKILEETVWCIVQKKEENNYEYALLINSDSLYKTTEFDKDAIYTETDIQYYDSPNPFNQLPFLRDNQYSQIFALNYLRPGNITITENYRMDAASFVAEIYTYALYNDNTNGQQELFAEIFSE
jgi:hypothetical protein